MTIKFLAIIAVCTLSACEKKQDAALAAPLPATTVPAVTPNPEFRKLLGKWQRPDGGYVLEIKTVDELGGKLEATYFNPQPINVSKALATQDGTSTKVFIELRAPNYPGSTYTLVFDPAADQLKGIYFQAALHQQFEVSFQRLK
ncbi:MAG: hypothetical protein RLZZ282_55 [Verrucomicrobiota bacterium]|jgi:uncharacterized protein (DUF2147 family)